MSAQRSAVWPWLVDVTCTSGAFRHLAQPGSTRTLCNYEARELDPAPANCVRPMCRKCKRRAANDV